MLDSRIAIVTGASKGIGLATAQRFLDADYRVINISRSPCSLEGVQNIKWDLSKKDWASESDTLLELIGETSEICLVHNSAVMTKESVRDIEADSLRQVLELNVVAAARLNTLLLPKMGQGSSIVYISSTLGTKAVPNTHSYVVSKHAVIGQMRATCQDLAGAMVHTAAICPGFTETEMLSEHLGSNPDIREQINAGIAFGRLVQPSEIAETVYFVARNPAVNGTILHANLGQIEN